MRSVLVPAMLVVLLATALAAPLCDIDYEVAASAKIRGSIRPAASCDAFVLDLPRGAAVSARATAFGPGAPTPRLIFSHVEGSTTNGDAAPHGQKLATAATASGVHRLRVFGDGVAEGDYQLALTVKPLGRWNLAGDAAPAAENTASFAAPAGSTARVRLTPARGSAFVPDLVALDGPDGFSATLSGGGSSGVVPLGGTGEYTVRFNGGAGGTWTARVDVVAPGGAARLDLTDGALTGDAHAGTPAAARIVGPTGGAVVLQSNEAGLAGASCTLPPNALAARTTVLVALGREFGTGLGVHPTGPFVRVAGPAAGAFAAPVTVSLPFVAARYQDPASELTIYRRSESGGAATTVPKPYDFGGPAGTAKFLTTTTGTFVATTTRARPLDGAWKLVRFSNDAQDGYIGSVTCTISDAAATPGSLAVTGLAGARATWTPSAPDVAAAVSESVLTTTSGSVMVEDDDRVIAFDAAASRVLTFARGWGDDVLVSAGIGTSAVTGFDVPQLDLLLRDAGPATASRVAGRYSFLLLSAGGASRSTGKVLLSTRQIAGSAVLDSAGRATFSTKGGHQALTDFPLDPSGWTESAASAIPAAQWSVEGGAVRVGFAVGGVASVDLHPVMRGNVLVGVVGSSSGSGSEIGFLLLAREGVGRAAPQLAGTNAAVCVIESLRERVVHDQGYGIGIGRGASARTATSAVLTFESGFSVEHDLTTGAAFGNAGGLPGRDVDFRLTPTGRYSDTGTGLPGENVLGFVTPRGDLLFELNAGDHYLETVLELPSTPPQ